MRRTWTLLPALVALLLAWPLLVQASRDHQTGSASHASSPLGQSGGSVSPSPIAPASASMSMPVPTTDAPTTSAAAKPRHTKAKPTITFSVVPSPVKTPTTRPRRTVPPTSPAPRSKTAAPTTPAPTTPAPTTKPSPKPTHKPKPVVTTSAPQLTGGTVTMGNFQYAMPAHVSPGARIAIYNADSVGHTLTIASAGIDVVVAGNSGGYMTAPSAPGSYAITCDYHADMTATLIVR